MNAKFISEHAVIMRVNRKLHHQEMMLRTTRSARACLDLGRHYLVDWRTNFAVETHCDLESLARELGVLKDWEAIREEV